MTVRLDMINGIKADMHTWFWEAADSAYKSLTPIYKKIADIGDVSSIKGGYWKGTSAIGATQLEEVINGQEYSEDHPIEGYPVYAKIRSKALKIQIPREFQRDWHRTKDFLREYVKEQWPMAIEYSKEAIVHNMYNKGGFTSGDDSFNNDDSDLNLTTYSSPKLSYDGKPFIARSGNNHTAKNASTYYNGLALTGVDLANAKQMFNLLTATNAYMENGQAFDNGLTQKDIVVLTHNSLALDWYTVLNSTLNPDNAENAVNPLKGMVKEVIASPYITTSTMSVMLRPYGVKAWFGKPKFNFWVENDPETMWASVILDYAVCHKNFRAAVGNNVPTS